MPQIVRQGQGQGQMVSIEVKVICAVVVIAGSPHIGPVGYNQLCQDI